MSNLTPPKYIVRSFFIAVASAGTFAAAPASAEATYSSSPLPTDQRVFLTPKSVRAQEERVNTLQSRIDNSSSATVATIAGADLGDGSLPTDQRVLRSPYGDRQEAARARELQSRTPDALSMRTQIAAGFTTGPLPTDRHSQLDWNM